MDNATWALARMNMSLHDCTTAEIWKDNTLAAPHFKDAKGYEAYGDAATATLKSAASAVAPVQSPAPVTPPPAPK